MLKDTGGHQFVCLCMPHCTLSDCLPSLYRPELVQRGPQGIGGSDIQLAFQKVASERYELPLSMVKFAYAGQGESVAASFIL